MPAPARAKETPIEALPLEERIRRRAYELYVERGDQSDSELDDWLQAEEEVLQTQEQPSPTKADVFICTLDLERWAAHWSQER
jgi:Protein of unknown function (DUF2934)